MKSLHAGPRPHLVRESCSWSSTLHHRIMCRQSRATHLFWWNSWWPSKFACIFREGLWQLVRGRRRVGGGEKPSAARHEKRISGMANGFIESRTEFPSLSSRNVCNFDGRHHRAWAAPADPQSKYSAACDTWFLCLSPTCMKWNTCTVPHPGNPIRERAPIGLQNEGCFFIMVLSF